MVDVSEEIEEIVWRVDSKIAEVRRTSGSTKKNLRFDYDAMGNRIAKHIFANNAFTQWERSTYYVRDASGNVMATYEREATGQEPPSSFRVTERHLYGSSRLGIDATPHEFIGSTYTASTEAVRTLGHKHYEISNHLGNVLSVITDQKLPVLVDSTVVSYAAVVLSATDYSPFGVGLYGRNWSEGYRYGFQGQEKDDEVKGESNSLNYKYRMHDPRLGRFFAVDPLAYDYPWNSPFAFSANRVIDGVELEGKEFLYSANGEFLGKIGDKTTIVVLTNKALITYSIQNTDNGYIRKKNIETGPEYINFMQADVISRSNVANSIFRELMGSNHKNTTVNLAEPGKGYIGNCDCDGSGNSIDGSGNPTINIASVDIFNDMNNFKSILLKESQHLSDGYLLGADSQRDLEAHHKILGSNYWLNSTNDFKKTFLQSAGNVIWNFMQAGMNSKDDSEKANYEGYVQRITTIYRSQGVEFDFSKQFKAYKFMGGPDGNDGNGARIIGDPESIGVSVNGEEL
ncbi:MAG: hypothetical protein GC193_08785 [Cryomorphaceae bacterium]|nr:hypothetical protein [Cryomorphaceae bacterium]